MSKSALHRRRSSSGDRINSASVTTDLDPTASLSLGFSNLGDWVPQSRLDTKTKANENNEKEHITHNTHINTYITFIMNTDPAPKPVSKSALHRRRSSSGDRINSPSVITDHDPTVSLSLSFSNLGDFATQSHLDTKTKPNEHNEKDNITHNDRANTYNELPGDATDSSGVDTLKASTDDRDGDSLAQSLSLTLADLVAAGPAPREGSFPPIE